MIDCITIRVFCEPEDGKLLPRQQAEPPQGREPGGGIWELVTIDYFAPFAAAL
jgi:hypothetical protein